MHIFITVPLAPSRLPHSNNKQVDFFCGSIYFEPAIILIIIKIAGLKSWKINFIFPGFSRAESMTF